MKWRFREYGGLQKIYFPAVCLKLCFKEISRSSFMKFDLNEVILQIYTCCKDGRPTDRLQILLRSRIWMKILAIWPETLFFVKLLNFGSHVVKFRDRIKIWNRSVGLPSLQHVFCNMTSLGSNFMKIDLELSLKHNFKHTAWK